MHAHYNRHSWIRKQKKTGTQTRMYTVRMHTYIYSSDTSCSKDCRPATTSWKLCAFVWVCSKRDKRVHLSLKQVWSGSIKKTKERTHKVFPIWKGLFYTQLYCVRKYACIPKWISNYMYMCTHASERKKEQGAWRRKYAASSIKESTFDAQTSGHTSCDSRFVIHRVLTIDKGHFEDPPEFSWVRVQVAPLVPRPWPTGAQPKKLQSLSDDNFKASIYLDGPCDSDSHLFYPIKK